MAKLSLICHRCQHRYRAKRMDTCPKCGGSIVGPTRQRSKFGLYVVVLGLALLGAYVWLGKTPTDLVKDAQDALPPGVPGAKQAAAEEPATGK
ncbi:MAG: hypothetical protein KDD82_00675 [Planctomycetes bacterium]|nr:hypothetical protein [Planctomycetota bacterium]